MYYPLMLTCEQCQQDAEIERIAVSSEGCVEILVTCLGCDDPIVYEGHFADLVAKVAMEELRQETATLKQQGAFV